MTLSLNSFVSLLIENLQSSVKILASTDRLYLLATNYIEKVK